ncbi:dnaJ homolog subfamily B member 14 [Scaptodrosophila lebanonensis]|uniref:DnaJ homolog subfamily B member 14 n=1 Tax=Drosophila lebanonensis TaxID=7225 RepID=A0A6J2T418_DROLE|nr:dnaJ homolog subfamily B member 14 [Scaptodrosophila lebanonensis]
MHRFGDRRGSGMMSQRRRSTESRIDQIVYEVTLGNYMQAMIFINDGLGAARSNEEILALMELKNIVVRLRMKCESNVQFGPTRKSPALPRGFTVEMLDVVQKVLRCRNHYEVLRVSHHATYSEVKRSYKRLALRLHPDKNQAPGAEDAFRRISDAADVLTDNQKRIEYNLHMVVGNSHGGHGFFRNSMFSQTDYSESDWQEPHTSASTNSTDDELGDFDNQNGAYEEPNQRRRRPYEPANQRVPQTSSLYPTEQLIMGVVASVLLIFISLHYWTASANYSFSATSTFSVRRSTQQHGIPYYVTPEFAEKHPGISSKKMEQEIEHLFFADLKYNCKQERQIRDSLLNRARLGNNRNLRLHALKMSMPACYALYKLSHKDINPLLLENKSEHYV